MLCIANYSATRQRKKHELIWQRRRAEWRNGEEREMKNTNVTLLCSNVPTFSTNSCSLVAVPQLRSFMLHPAIWCILYVTLYAQWTDAVAPLTIFFNESDHPGLESYNWPQSSLGPANVSMVTRDHLLSLRGGVQRADESGSCAQCKDQPTQIPEHPSITAAALCIQHLYTHTASVLF